MTKFETKGLENLQRKLKDMADRAKALDGAEFEVEGGVTPEKREEIRKEISEHVLQGKPLKTKRKR